MKEYKPNTYLLVWEEEYSLKSDIGMITENNLETLQSKGVKSDVEISTIRPYEATYSMLTDDEKKFKEAISSIITMRGDVLSSLITFVVNSEEKGFDWDSVEKYIEE